MPTLVAESKTIQRDLLTAGDFLDWLAPGVHADLIDGETAMHSPVNLRHADLLNFVDRLLAGRGRDQDAGGGWIPAVSRLA